MPNHATITVELDKAAIRAGLTEAFARLDVEEAFAIVIGLARPDSDTDRLRARALAWTTQHVTVNVDQPASRCDRAHHPGGSDTECSWASVDETWCNAHLAYRQGIADSE